MWAGPGPITLWAETRPDPRPLPLQIDVYEWPETANYRVGSVDPKHLP